MQGVADFLDGNCFPQLDNRTSQEMGIAANRGPHGIYYLATRDQSPYCGIFTFIYLHLFISIFFKFKTTFYYFFFFFKEIQ